MTLAWLHRRRARWWVWSGAADGSAVGGAHTNWTLDQPDNGSGMDEHCLVFLFEEAFGVEGWNDAGCGERASVTLCESPP